MSSSEAVAGPARSRRYDPDRRDHIIDACIEVIATVGVVGTSLRRVAAAAEVPLGSMTYHFTGREELLREALTRFAGIVATRFEKRMGDVEAGDTVRGVQEVIDLIRSDVFVDNKELVLSHELYTLAARDPAYRQVTKAWMARSRAALERVFDPLTARLIDALIEGMTIHRALDTEPHDNRDVEIAVRRITSTSAVEHTGP